MKLQAFPGRGLRRLWHAECTLCCYVDCWVIRPGGRGSAERTLRANGWGKRRGYWICAGCLAKIDTGALTFEPGRTA